MSSSLVSVFALAVWWVKADPLTKNHKRPPPEVVALILLVEF